ncbi:hypothetical protein BDW59DRAFT_153212 [Aspergillus cavernicola]|uniref:Uncharacterized protein n=1 Tax=Aspergillus cavernicola TaxID=176166 RepID=A0ABR4HLQ9_9EURO
MSSEAICSTSSSDPSFPSSRMPNISTYEARSSSAQYIHPPCRMGEYTFLHCWHTAVWFSSVQLKRSAPPQREQKKLLDMLLLVVGIGVLYGFWRFELKGPCSKSW